MLNVGKQLFSITQNLMNAQNYMEERNTMLKFIKMVVPEMKVTGDQEFPPRHSDDQGITLIISNHVSDADQMLIMSKLAWYDDSKNPTKFTGFTYNSFQNIPVLGYLVGRSYVGLEQGEPDSDIEKKISWLMNQGFNTWLLFPEGTLFDKITYKKSIAYQTELGIPTNKHLHHVLYPRARALNAFLKQAGNRLRFLVDITLEYEGIDLKTRERSYITYPSACYGLFVGLGRPSMHIHTYVIDDQCRQTMMDFVDDLRPPPWLRKIWKIKDTFVQQKSPSSSSSQSLQSVAALPVSTMTVMGKQESQESSKDSKEISTRGSSKSSKSSKSKIHNANHKHNNCKNCN